VKQPDDTFSVKGNIWWPEIRSFFTDSLILLEEYLDEDSDDGFLYEEVKFNS